MIKYEKGFADPFNENNQYSLEERTQKVPVPAKYRNTGIDEDAANIFVSALPFSRTEEQVYQDYAKEISILDYNKLQTISDDAKIRMLNNIKSVRIPLNYQNGLEKDFNSILVDSYRKRRLVIGPGAHTIITTDQGAKIIPAKLVADEADGTDCGIALLGFSGSGKSTTANTLLSNYPQYIEHTLPDGSVYPQIVYLVINCTENRDFKTLLIRIARTLDNIMQIGSFCQDELKRCKNSGSMTDKICDFIQTFSVGAIVIDEIQEMDFQNTAKGTFSNIMTIANCTKVGLFVIGTEAAFVKMFTNQWVLRRVGHMIHANDYCRNRYFFTYVTKYFLQYQYIDKPIVWSQELDDAFFDNSGGIISIFRNLYIEVQKAYLMADKNSRPEITPEFIDDVADKNFAGYRNYLKQQLDPFELVAADVMKKQKEGNESVSKSINNSLKNLDDLSDEKQVFDLFSYVYNYILARTHDYNEDTVKKVYLSIWKTNKYHDLPFDDFAEAVYSHLKSRSRSDKRKQAHPVSYEDKRKALGLNTETAESA